MTSPEPVVSRPVVLTRVCWALVGLIMVVFVAVAVALGRSEGPVQFQLTDQVAMVVLGGLLSSAVLALTRARVRADLAGVRVRNVLGEKLIPWQVVRDVQMGEGASWASLELQDDDTVALLAVQRNDGDRAVEVILALRALLVASRRTSPATEG